MIPFLILLFSESFGLRVRHLILDCFWRGQEKMLTLLIT